MRDITLFTSRSAGNAGNIYYPIKTSIHSPSDLQEATRLDHVGVELKDGYRKNENFIRADCIIMDIDNDHSDNPNDWVTFANVSAQMPDVQMYAVASRHNQLPKGNLSARPRFHIYFPVPLISTCDEYSAIKTLLCDQFPFFDRNARDAARFIFGVKSPKIKSQDGSLTVIDWLSNNKKKNYVVTQSQNLTSTPKRNSKSPISEGNRNTSMYTIAVKLIKRYGPTYETKERYLQEANRCTPPLSTEELKSIWKSAAQFFTKSIENNPNYIPPNYYNAAKAVDSLMPEDYTDIGQAKILVEKYTSHLKYSDATRYLYYDGNRWIESELMAQLCAIKLTDDQLAEAKTATHDIERTLKSIHAWDCMRNAPKEGAPEELRAIYDRSRCYYKHALRCRSAKSLNDVLKAAKPFVQIDINQLDAEPYYLNTPSYTYDLRRGTNDPISHNPDHLITQITTVDPSSKNQKMWDEALNQFFCNDEELIEYVQRIIGLATIGSMKVEAMIIAYGNGSNGKSTFFNSIFRVLGTYAGRISADTLTAGCRRNIKPELAEARGKRLLIAAELEEGTRLSTSAEKQLCSTDEIFAEKKYKAPFFFKPSHLLVLYTNHLPRVGALDNGTWRRLIVIPFNAVIGGQSDKKNYADILVEQAGSAILSWCIEGARKIIQDNFILNTPKIVSDAIHSYREENNWLSHFLEECCNIGDNLTVKSGELYTRYRTYCMQYGEFARSTNDFYKALTESGFERKRTNKWRIIVGLEIKSEDTEDDFLMPPSIV